MAELIASAAAPANAASPHAGPHPPGPPAPRSPTAAQQLRAIAWLRWRILANGFRRKGGAGELIVRIFVLPIFAAFALLPTAAAGFLAYEFTHDGQFERLGWVLWGAFALSQVLNLNLGQPGTTFDPIELIRFPMPLGRWVLVRLCFGLLGPANMIISLISLAMIFGITLASPRLFIPALLALLVFGLTNILFTRMIFAWVDRWLSTRRAREVFTGFIFALSLGFQAVNARFNPGFAHNRHRRAPGAGIVLVQTLAHRAHPVSIWLPPGLTARALGAAAQGDAVAFVTRTALCAAFAAFFLWIYTLRMRTEFRGENLSDAANLTRPAAGQTTSPTGNTVLYPAVAAQVPTRTAASTWFPATLTPLLGKELLTLRRNTGLFYGLIAPAVMVFLFVGRASSRSGSHWVLLAAVAYALLGVAPMGFNSLGMEGTGAQFYFMAPVPLREVFFAKNIFNLLIAFAEVLLVTAITAYVAGRPSWTDCAMVMLWSLGTLLLIMTAGNRRSLAAPRKVNPGRTLKKAQSPLSTYLSIGIMLGCVALGLGSELLAVFLGKLWIGPLLMLAFAAASAVVYDGGLKGIEAYALEHRDTLFEELGKKT